MHTFQLQKAAGVTLIEMMFALAVMGILVAMSMPAFGTLMQKSQQETARDALIASLNNARMSAVTRAGEVSLCPSADHASCDNSIEWQHGWIVFVDSNGNGKRDADETLLRVENARAGVGIVSTTGRRHVSFRPDGGSPGTNLTLAFCDKRGADKAIAIVVNNAGRTRQDKATTAQAQPACAALPI